MDSERIAAGLLDAGLPQTEWTHRGHITAAHVLIRDHGAAETVVLCRRCIPRLNDAHGVANSDTGGYHETLTVFFVSAVSDAVVRGLTIDETVAELCSDAALQWWSEPVLMSTAARRAFVAPDIAAPPFVLLSRPEGDQVRFGVRPRSEPVGDQPRLRSLRICGQVRVLTMSAFVAQPRRAVSTP